MIVSRQNKNKIEKKFTTLYVLTYLSSSVFWLWSVFRKVQPFKYKIRWKKFETINKKHTHFVIPISPTSSRNNDFQYGGVCEVSS